MPAVSKDQFWKSNPNQMALPGMEEQAHPGAVYLKQGYSFDTHVGGPTVRLRAKHPTAIQGAAASLRWSSSSGEIEGVGTRVSHQGKGLATALYGMGRTMTKRKPQHSPIRTAEGDAWAPKASAKYGGRIPKMSHDPRVVNVDNDSHNYG